MCFLLAFYMSTRLFLTGYKALCITQGHVASTHFSNTQSNSGTNCIHQQSLNNCWNQIDTRFLEVDIEISLWRWLVTCPSGCVLMTGELRMIALWSCCSDWRQTDSKHWGPCIHRINSVYCILSTDTYTMLMSGGVIRKIHCIVLYCIFIQLQSLIETIEEPTIFLLFRECCL